MANFTMSCDDGCDSDVRVAQLAKEYKVDCVFYWPVEVASLAYSKGYKPLSPADAFAIAEKFEVGSHTITHRHLTDLSGEDAFNEIVYSKELLENIYDKGVTKFAPPRGYTNSELTELTLAHYKTQRLTKGEGLLHVHPSSGANNNMDWREYAKTIDVKELWFHSWELDKYNLWEQLEEYLSENAHR